MDALGGEDLVSVAFANDRAEGDMIKGLLESAGIPSVLQQIGIDGAGLGIGLLNPGGGSRRVMAPTVGSGPGRWAPCCSPSESSSCCE
jgi:hypothetical protein